MKGRIAMLVVAPVALGLAARLAVAGEHGWGMWLVWTLVFAALGGALGLTLDSGNPARYRAARTLVVGFALYNLALLSGFAAMPLLICATLAAIINTRRFWKIDRRAGLCAAAFALLCLYEILLRTVIKAQ
ncbi:hypothetical protein FACS1894217_09560 [Clostridia bacterium]|nr:hypothetical protein FACS1894217_09560 [Clostridia bacterium]